MNIIKILAVAAGVTVAGLAGLAITNQGNIAETSEDAKDENFKTRYYQTDLKTFVEETKKMIPAMATYGQNWKLIDGGDSEGQQNSATIAVEVPVAFFIDDLKINAEKEANTDKIKVNLHSKSRMGKSDLGENKRHVLQLLKVLDEKFKK